VIKAGTEPEKSRTNNHWYSKGFSFDASSYF